MDMKDKVVWITGASSGIGQALATVLESRGARLVVSARRVDRLEELCARCGPHRCRVVPLDLADHGSLAAAAAQVEQMEGRIDVLINNAGVSQRSLFQETEPSVIHRIADTDLLGPILLSRAVVEGMVRRGTGSLVYVTSLVGKVATPLRTIYAASKHGLHGFADSLRAELWGKGIRVSVVAPGFVRTEISHAALEGDGKVHARMDPGQAGGVTAEKCAARIVRAVERGEREVYVGLGARGSLGLTLSRVAPALLARIMRKAVVV